MALTIDRGLNGPQTHILIIGVGGYPFLKGGLQAKPQTFDGAQLLGQLSSPPVSAEHFFNTALEIETMNAWVKPLGSIEVLNSPHPTGKKAFAGSQPEVPTRKNIKSAYQAWKARCNADKENVAIFFYSGHGLDKGEHYLLAADFGEDPADPWEGAFAFDLTRRAFFSCKAGTQLFFVDACRQLTSDMLKTDLAIQPLEQASFEAKHCAYNLTQKAAADNESSYGKKNDVSFYTKALTGALKGDAVNNDNDEWRISTGTLASEMNRYLKSVAPSENYPQRCISVTSDITDIIRFDTPPMVPVAITCDPAAALKLAELSFVDPATNEGFKRPPEARPWELEVKAGLYKIQAVFNGGQFKECFAFKNVKPPSFKHKLTCVP